MRNLPPALARWWLNRRLPGNLRAGDVCVIASADGGYKILKVLLVEPDVIHVRLYKDRFPRFPSGVRTEALNLGTINDTDGFGVGHLPLSRETFATGAPTRIGREAVTSEELEGYRLWEEHGGGTWG